MISLSSSFQFSTVRTLTLLSSPETALAEIPCLSFRRDSHPSEALKSSSPSSRGSSVDCRRMGPVTVSPCSRASIRNSNTTSIYSYLAFTFTRLRLEPNSSAACRTSFLFFLILSIELLPTPKCSATLRRQLPRCSSMSSTALRCLHVSRAYLGSDFWAMKEKH